MLVTGASQGIGSAVLYGLARAGHAVLGVSRTKPEQPPTGPTWRSLDLSNAAGVEEFVSTLESSALRALVLCAVDYGEGGRHPAAGMSAKEWQRVVATNCIGHCVLVSRLLPRLLANALAIVVNISSDVAVLPSAGRAAYAASKAGLHAMLRTVAAEHASDCLRVYQLIPTFQLATHGLRRRRPASFDFSSYADPAVMAEVVGQVLSTTGDAIAAGTYLVQRDGSLNPFAEATQL